MASSPTFSEPLKLPFPWKQGEHLSVVGDTGTGKSTLISRLLLSRLDSITVVTKPDDVKRVGKTVRSVKDIDDPRETHWILQPPYERQYQEIRNVYELTWKEPGWCLCIDELYYVDDFLKMQRLTNRALTQGRSKKLTMVMGMQRPVLVTRFALSQSTHLIVFQQDDRDAKTIGEAAGGKALAQRVMQLGRHEFLWYYRPERQFWVGRYNIKSGELEGVKGARQNEATLAR